MAKMVEVDWNPAERTLRQFGWIALAAFGALAALAYFERGIFAFGLGEARTTVVAVLAGIGGVAALFSLVRPQWNRWLFVGLTLAAFPIGFVLSYVILGFVFYLVVAPIGLLLRLVGKDPMDRRFRPELASYWTQARPPRPKESYFRQF